VGDQSITYWLPLATPRATTQRTSWLAAGCTHRHRDSGGRLLLLLPIIRVVLGDGLTHPLSDYFGGLPGSIFRRNSRMSSHASLGYGVAPVHGRPITVVRLGIGFHGMADYKRGARP
jgi:hypothetical protein